MESFLEYRIGFKSQIFALFDNYIGTTSINKFQQLPLNLLICQKSMNFVSPFWKLENPCYHNLYFIDSAVWLIWTKCSHYYISFLHHWRKIIDIPNEWCRILDLEWFIWTKRYNLRSQIKYLSLYVFQTYNMIKYGFFASLKLVLSARFSCDSLSLAKQHSVRTSLWDRSIYHMM